METSEPETEQNAGHRLFVGGLPSDCSKQDLETVFGTYGMLENVHIMQPKSKYGLRCAFVTYVDRDSAEDAIKVLDGIYKIREDADAPIQVSWPRPNSIPHEWEKGGEKGKRSDQFAGRGKGPDPKGDWVKGSEWSHGWSKGQDPAWEHSSFDPGGGWCGVKGPAWGKGKRPDWRRGDWVSKGEISSKGDYYGKGSSSSWAVPAVGGKAEKGKGGWDQPPVGGLEEKGKGGPPSWDQPAVGSTDEKGKGGGDGGEGFRLFVGSLPADCREQEIDSVFRTYGEVISARLINSHAEPTARGRCAFVTYADRAAAEDAIRLLDGGYRMRDKSEQPIEVRWANERRKGGKDVDKGWFKGGKSSWLAPPPWLQVGKGKGPGAWSKAGGETWDWGAWDDGWSCWDSPWDTWGAARQDYHWDASGQFAGMAGPWWEDFDGSKGSKTGMKGGKGSKMDYKGGKWGQG